MKRVMTEMLLILAGYAAEAGIFIAATAAAVTFSASSWYERKSGVVWLSGLCGDEMRGFIRLGRKPVQIEDMEGCSHIRGPPRWS